MPPSSEDAALAKAARRREGVMPDGWGAIDITVLVGIFLLALLARFSGIGRDWWPR